jgi:hypothetical protein
LLPFHIENWVTLFLVVLAGVLQVRHTKIELRSTGRRLLYPSYMLPDEIVVGMIARVKRIQVTFWPRIAILLPQISAVTVD